MFSNPEKWADICLHRSRNCSFSFKKNPHFFIQLNILDENLQQCLFILYILYYIINMLYYIIYIKYVIENFFRVQKDISENILT